MPIRRLPIHEIPIGTIPGRSYYWELPEFGQLASLIKAGIRPTDALEIELPAEALQRTKTATVSFMAQFRKQFPARKFKYVMFRRAQKLYVQSSVNGKKD